MGSTEDYDEKPIHSLRVSSFYLSKYEVTQRQWEAIMGSNPSKFEGCGECPVEQVSWEDVQEFIVKLNRLAGKTYRLPTEAEWEYAARGGQKSQGNAYAGEASLATVGRYAGNSDTKTHPVGQKESNELGLYDMSGNVWEWCQDWYGSGYYQNSPSSNPAGPSTGGNRVVRGGSWYDGPARYRVAYRNYYPPSNRRDFLGFRLLRTE